jgi:hypothetical protein
MRKVRWEIKIKLAHTSQLSDLTLERRVLLMNNRRITLTLGMAAGGLLAGTLFPMAIALADPDTGTAGGMSPATDVFGFLPTGEETVEAVSGLPPLDQEVIGTQFFKIPDVNPSDPDLFLGSLDADVSNFTSPFGFSNEEILVTRVVSGANETGVPGTGSVFDDAILGNGFENEYSDVVTGAGASATDTVTDTLVTPFGDVDLTPLVSDFHAAVYPGDMFFPY